MTQFGRSGFCVAVVVLLSVAASSLAASTSTRNSGPTSAGPMEAKVNKVAVASAFSNAGKTDGLEIWRVENFAPVPVKKVDFGKFHSGDSYLIMKTKAKAKQWDIYYWIGKETSQDESGAVAIFAVELDNSLGGSPTQHRETQEHESREFQALFPSGIRYLPGGINSGFHHVNPNEHDKTVKLYEVKGKKHIRVKLVEPKVTSMNKGDSYILDDGKAIFVYYGANSQRGERLKAVSAANNIRDQDHSGRAKVNVIDESATPEEVAEFFEKLGGGNRKSVRESSPRDDDTEYERNFDANVDLYKVSDASGSLKVDKVAQKPLMKSSLNTNDAFILDTKSSGIFYWVGRKATKGEKENAMKKAQEFLKSKNYPAWTPVSRVIESGEPSTFKQYFEDWRNEEDRVGFRGRRSASVSSEEHE